MEKNQRYIIAAVIVIAVIAGWQLLKKPAEVTQENQSQNQSENTTTQGDDSNSNTNQPENSTPTISSNTWEGVLKTSDNSKKGGLMLVTKDHTIYLKTSRDFSALIGKQVVVSYEGDLNSFVLGDITAK